MRAKSIVHVLISLAALCAFLMAKEIWEKPYSEWKRNDALKMLNDSPWAKSQTVVSTVSGRTDGSSGVGGQNELYSTVTVRFFSALPVRHAYFRMMQLMNNYDARTDAEKAEIDARFSKVVKMDFSKSIMVALEFATNDQQTKTNVAKYFEYLKIDHIKQSCYLISQRLGRVSVEEYYPPSPDGTGAKFVFPRIVGEKPVVIPEDKELTFDMWMEPINQRVFIRFRVKDLMYGGALSL